VRPEDAIDGIGCGSLSWRRFLGMMLLGSYKCNKHQWKRPCARHPRDTHGHRGEETLAEGWESGSLIAGPCESVAQSKFIEGGVGGGGGALGQSGPFGLALSDWSNPPVVANLGGTPPHQVLGFAGGVPAWDWWTITVKKQKIIFVSRLPIICRRVFWPHLIKLPERSSD